MHTLTPTNPLAFREAVAATDGVVLVDFTAAWCPPCRLIEPILEQLATEHDDLTIMTVDVDESPAVAAAYGVMSMPTLMFFAAGEPVHRVIGARGLPAMRAAVDAARTAAQAES
jgi:thioredoxin 1